MLSDALKHYNEFLLFITSSLKTEQNKTKTKTEKREREGEKKKESRI